jgi:ribonuclease HI
MCEAVLEEVQLGAVRRIRREEVLWEHRTGLVPKPGGKMRKITDCSQLNIFLRKIKFKMEDNRVLQFLLPQGAYATSKDISKAYLHIHVQEQDQPFLCFSHDNETFCYTSMPFGLSTAPRTFTLLMRKCIQAIRQRWEVTALHYLDDLLFLHNDPAYLRKATEEIDRFLSWLGWITNNEKSEPEPKQVFVFLGWEWDSRTRTVKLPANKARDILHALRHFNSILEANLPTSARRLAKMIGTLGATRFQFRQASLHLRSLDTCKIAMLKACGWDGKARVEMSREVREEIHWWMQAITTNEPRRVTHTPPQATMFTDASPIGWGAHVQIYGEDDLLMHGRWRRKATSNALECAAVEKALRQLRRWEEGRHISSVLVRSDNTTTCYNINRQSAGDTLLPPLLSLLRYAERAQIELVAEHVPGVENSTADRISRISPGGDYALRPETMQKIEMTWGVRIGADLFASGWNAKHPLYFSPQRDRNARGRNAFAARWAQFTLPLLHPPIPLLPRVLRRLQLERMQAIVILPLWTRQPWGALLRSMAVHTLDLGPAEEVLIRGRGMATVRADLPPGNMAAVLTDTRTTREKRSSTPSSPPNT